MPAGSSLNSVPQAPDSAHLAQPWSLRSISQVRTLSLRGQKLSRRPPWLRQDSSPDLADLSQSCFPGVVGPLPSPVGKVQAQPHQQDSRPVWRLDLRATEWDGVRTTQWCEIENPGERIKFLSTGSHTAYSTAFGWAGLTLPAYYWVLSQPPGPGAGVQRRRASVGGMQPAPTEEACQ